MVLRMDLLRKLARLLVPAAVILMLMPAISAHSEPTPGQRCAAGKNGAVGKYATCRHKAEARRVLTGNQVQYGEAVLRCVFKFNATWQRLDAKAAAAGSACDDAPLQAATFEAFLAQASATAAAVLSGADLPACGDGERNVVGEECDGADVGGNTCASLGFLSGTLGCPASCTLDTSSCRSQLVPATGQTTGYGADKNDGVVGVVPVPDDGTLQQGAALTFIDNGDGTITDLNTGLMWEKKGDDGGLHDKDHVFLWSGNGAEETIWDWLDDVNAENGVGFAGYDDWRVPNLRELLLIADYEATTPCTQPAFDTGCAPGCSPISCSCTGLTGFFGGHWTSSTVRINPSTSAWAVSLINCDVGAWSKATQPSHVRAVRGG